MAEFISYMSRGRNGDVVMTRAKMAGLLRRRYKDVSICQRVWVTLHVFTRDWRAMDDTVVLVC